jgi:hypothetical protein
VPADLLHVPPHNRISALQAAQHLDLLNKADNVGYAGAWRGYVFYEDGFRAGLGRTRFVQTSTKTRHGFGRDILEWIVEFTSILTFYRGFLSEISIIRASSIFFPQDSLMDDLLCALDMS